MKLFPGHPVLLVDDEELLLDGFERILRRGGITNIIKCSDSREVLAVPAGRPVECILLDMVMPHISGLELLPQLKEKFPGIPVIVITGVDDVKTAVECIKNGACDYMVKPIEKNRLVSGVKRLIAFNELKKRYARLQRSFFSDEPDNPGAFKDIVTDHPGMKSIFRYIEVIAPSPEPVLITGETGVGKELAARVIHKLSKRKGNFTAVNVSGVDDAVFSDTLFGHERGAFTDAVSSRGGMIQTTSGGTLFLDEIGDSSMASQVKLLRLLQGSEYYPLGSDVPKYTDARVIVAVNCDLKSLMESGRFRKDLYHRLSVHRIHMPPLRERLGDIPLLTAHFLEEASKTLKKKKPTVPKELFPLLKTYHFPGNIRELRAMVIDAVGSHKAMMLSLKSFKEAIGDQKGRTSDPTSIVTFSDNLPTLKQFEQILIEEALERSGNNQTIAAQILGISRQALNNRLQRKAK
ncbi:MAG: sigma-54-dependent Fis family transcriptional regulator [bacterium]|nr:sigma-54-dependent Fis family transcriptional regulator [bacterium]